MIEVSKKDRRKYEAILKEELLTALGWIRYNKLRKLKKA